ncbi:MAG: metallophosphoesterase, partial [Candidatus Thermoplasmatota archaeon]
MYSLFVSDLHGRRKHYEILFERISEDKPDAVFFGGDLLPNNSHINVKEFIEKFLFLMIKDIKKNLGDNTLLFMILGNDDPRIYEALFRRLEEKTGIVEYISSKVIRYKGFYIAGYS